MNTDKTQHPSLSSRILKKTIQRVKRYYVIVVSKIVINAVIDFLE